VRLSTRCRYGVRALLDIAGGYGKEPLKRKVIAQRQGLSEGYLQNLLVVLKNDGFLRTSRGPNGGYELARPPERITLLEVVEALEGPIVPVACLRSPACCDRVERCVARTVWDSVRKGMRDTLRGITLGELVKENGRQGKKRRQGRRRA
jgi:Rrf2 family protein